MSDSTVTAPDEIAAAPHGVRRTVKVALALGGAFVVGLVLFVVWREMYGPPRFTISKETTYITEPLRADGLPDYAAALDAMASEGVTPENNAAVLYWQAFGPGEVPTAYRAEFFGRLGMTVPPPDGNYFLMEAAFQQELERGPATGLEADIQASSAEEQSLDDEPSDFITRANRARRVPWSAAEFPDVDEWVRRNDRPLALIVEGTSRPKCYGPLLVSDQYDQLLILSAVILNIKESREAARVLLARAMQRLGRGERTEAQEDLLACHRFARHLARGHTLIDWLLGVAVESMTFDADAAVAHHGGLSSAEAMRYRDRLAELPPFPSVADKIDRCERFAFLDLTVRIARYGFGAFAEDVNMETGRFPKIFVDWDVPLLMGNDLYGRMAQAARAPTRAERQSGFDEINRLLRHMQDEARNPLRIVTDRSGIVADYLLALLLPATSKASNADDRRLMRADLVQLAFALAAHRADHGAYPAALDELAPRYIPNVPEDLFSGKPLIYRPMEDGGGYLLYSVGVNETDDDGRTDEDDPYGDDLVVRTPVPEPTP
ncbi:MAG: hypothetical protein WED34_15945 [Planctomycetales bacterium]